MDDSQETMIFKAAKMNQEQKMMAAKRLEKELNATSQVLLEGGRHSDREIAQLANVGRQYA